MIDHAENLMPGDLLRHEGRYLDVACVEKTGRDGRLAVFLKDEDNQEVRVTLRTGDEVDRA